jgi:multiple sugar transport system permease protein
MALVRAVRSLRIGGSGTRGARRLEQLHGWGFVLPCCLTLLAVLGAPIAISLFTSFRIQGPIPSYGLDNYTRLLADSLFFHSLRVSLTFVGATVALHLVLGMIVARALQSEIRARRLFRVLVILPWTIPDVISGLIWRFMYNPTSGIINHALESLAITEQPVDWLGSASLALPSVIQSDVWRGYPFVMIILLAGMQAIPRDLYEAARVDGASALQEFRYVTLPQLKGIIFIAVALDVIWQFRRFGLIFNMTAGGPGRVTEILSLRVYKHYFRFFEFEYASAMAVALAVVMVVISIPYVRSIVRREA